MCITLYLICHMRLMFHHQNAESYRQYFNLHRILLVWKRYHVHPPHMHHIQIWVIPRVHTDSAHSSSSRALCILRYTPLHSNSTSELDLSALSLYTAPTADTRIFLSFIAQQWRSDVVPQVEIFSVQPHFSIVWSTDDSVTLFSVFVWKVKVSR